MACFVVAILIFLCVARAEILEEPVSTVVFQGTDSTFRCRGTGNIFWSIDGQLYNFRSEGVFAERGFSLDQLVFSEDQSVSSSTITVQNSVAINNNTVIKCIVVGPNNEVNISQNASLTVLDLADPVILPESSNPREFEITWNRVYAPTGHEVEAYNVTVLDENNVILNSTVTSPQTSSFSYISGRTRRNFPLCSRLLFIVVAVNRNTNSRRASVSWDKPKNFDKISGEECTVVEKSNSIIVEFNKPEVCLFQSVNYSIRVSLKGESSKVVALETGPVVPGGDGKQMVVFRLGASQDFGKLYSAFIEVTMDQNSPVRTTINCLSSRQDPMIAGLNNSPLPTTELSGGHRALVAVLFVASVLLIAVNVVAICVYYFKK